jgi:hypothetical protein
VRDIVEARGGVTPFDEEVERGVQDLARASFLAALEARFGHLKFGGAHLSADN